MNILVEYYKRHGIKCAMSTNDGLCFFNEHNRPAIICLTGSPPKTYTRCYNCPTSAITVELFGPSREEAFIYKSHDHLHPDTDLCKHIGLSPVYLKTERDIELWLWSFFLFHHRLRYTRSYKEFAKDHDTTEEPLRTYEQMAWCAMNAPKTYKLYYTMYQTFVVGRKYLLFE